MNSSGYQAKTACGNLQLCAGLEASTEGATHEVRNRQMDRLVQSRRGEESEESGDNTKIEEEEWVELRVKIHEIEEEEV